MKYVNIVIYFLVGITLYLFASQWIFNHVDAWAGVATYAIGFIIILKLIIKQINKLK